MKAVKIPVLILLIALSFLYFSSALCQATDSSVVIGPAEPEEEEGPDTLWLWGEVVLVNPQEKLVNVKYLDYESDTEREIAITVDQNTVLDNIASLDQLKPKDTVSIDYITGADGVNLAKNISIEKPEEVETGEMEILEDQAPSAAIQ